MTIEIREVDSRCIDRKLTGLTILPANYSDNDGQYSYHSNNLSFYKYSKDKVEIDFWTPPELLFEQIIT